MWSVSEIPLVLLIAHLRLFSHASHQFCSFNTMAYPPSQTSDSIDQVIQSTESLQHVNQNRSNISLNRTAPLSPLPQHSGSPRRENNRRPKSQPTSQPPYEERRLGSAGRGAEKDRSRKMSMGQRDERSSKSGQTAVVNAPGRDNTADFFSWEVFQVVIHNPTTAHRFQRFCQSRACGENMEFLQQVNDDRP